MAGPIDDALASPVPPKSMTTAEGSAVQQSIPDLIAGEQYLAAKTAAARGFSFGGARVAQAVGPPQCDTGIIDTQRGDGGF